GLSGLSLMPVTGPMGYEDGPARVYPGPPDGPFGTMWTAGYRSRFRRETEHGAPGSYGVELLDWHVKVEVTATARCGLMRLVYPRTDQAHLLLDFAFPAEELSRIVQASVKQTGPCEIEGLIRQHNNYAGDFTVAFVLRASQPFASIDGWQRGVFTGPSTNYGTDWQTPVDYRHGIQAFQGHDGCGVALNFRTSPDRPVVIATGISLCDIAGARRNLAAELAPLGFDFDRTAAAARAQWRRVLGVVDVTGGTPAQRTMFYTCLYRAFSAKSLLQDVDGRYRDFTGRIRQAPPGENIFSSDSFWGCQWTLFPLWTLLSPATASAWDRFFVGQAKRWGWLPQAPVLGGYAPVMVAQHEQSLLVSSYQKGIRDFDVAGAYAAVRHDLTTPGTPMPNGGYAGDRNLAAYLAHGYVPNADGPTSNTFEYAYDDWAAGQFAAALGREADRREFQRRSYSWRNAINPGTGYACRRAADGAWIGTDLYRYGTTGGWNGPGFVEGNAWLYTFWVPQDLPALAAIPGRAEFNRRLEAGFAAGRVDLTNEENLQAPFIFNYTGCPWLTQKYVRQSLGQYWDPSPLAGWAGEEDEGQLSALYVLWAMGLFEMKGGCDVHPGYDLTSPLFDRIVLHLDPRYYPGGAFTIVAHGQGAEDEYVQSARLNGRPYARAWLSHEDLVRGGTLEYDLGAAPNPRWGTPPP
ncbi:MAG TPA: GH92 family glycosyl hydrolase, partial [Opitutaceae bacterium]|nr:GH92 family glycosyl hydrolase [Opitutaceae bacterium]